MSGKTSEAWTLGEAERNAFMSTTDGAGGSRTRLRGYEPEAEKVRTTHQKRFKVQKKLIFSAR